MKLFVMEDTVLGEKPTEAWLMVLRTKGKITTYQVRVMFPFTEKLVDSVNAPDAKVVARKGMLLEWRICEFYS